MASSSCATAPSEKLQDILQKLDSQYTHIQFYFAQVYGQLQRPLRAARYCEATLKRQLASPKLLDPLEWAKNARQLSTYYISHNRWTAAADVLTAADLVVRRAVGKKDPEQTGDGKEEAKSAGGSLHVGDDYETVDEGGLQRIKDKWDETPGTDDESSRRAVAEGGLFWGHYFSRVLQQARDRDLARQLAEGGTQGEESKISHKDVKEEEEEELAEDTRAFEAETHAFRTEINPDWESGPLPSKAKPSEDSTSDGTWEAVPGGLVWVHVDCPDWYPCPVKATDAAVKAGPPIATPAITTDALDLHEGSRFDFMYMLGSRTGHHDLYTDATRPADGKLPNYRGTSSHPFALVTAGQCDDARPSRVTDFASAREIFKKALVEFNEAKVSLLWRIGLTGAVQWLCWTCCCIGIRNSLCLTAL